MGIVFRQSVKTSFVLIFGALLGALILLLTTKFIPKQEYGFFTNFTKWAVMLANFAPLGLNSTIAVYIHKYNLEHAKRKLLITLCLGIPAIITLLITCIYFLAPNQIIGHFQLVDQPLMRLYFNWMPVYVLFFVYMIMLDQYLSSQMKVAITSFMREILIRLLSIIIIILFVFHFINFSAFFASSILAYIFPVLMLFYISFKTKGFGVSLRLDSFSKAEYKDLIQFSWFHYLLYISIMLMNCMDALLIPFYDKNGFSSLAAYTVASYLISLLGLPGKAFTQASFAAFAKAINNNEMNEAKDIFARSSINLFIPTVFIAILILCNLNNAVSVIGTGKNYSDLIPVAAILVIGNLVNAATGMNDQVLSITNYYRFNFYLSLIVIVMLFIMIRLLVPHYGIIGAAIASSLTMTLYNVAKYFFVWKKLDMQPFSVNTLKILVAALPALAIGYFFPYLFNPDRHVYLHTFIDAAIRSSLIMIVYFLMLLWIKPSKDLEDYLASVKKNKRLF